MRAGRNVGTILRAGVAAEAQALCRLVGDGRLDITLLSGRGDMPLTEPSGPLEPDARTHSVLRHCALWRGDLPGARQ